MLRSCLVLLGCYALLYAGYYWWLGQTFDPPGLWVGAGVVALIVGGSLGALYNARIAYREWSLVAADRHGLPWSDGRWTAVTGEIHPVSESFAAPFSGTECVLCEYDVTTQRRATAASQNDNSNPGSDFTGFLMNPCVVRGPMGDVRLLGFPNLVGFGERICDSSEAVQNARAFLLGTKFENYSGLRLVSVFSAIKDAWNDDDGLVRKNLRLGKMTPEDLFQTGGEFRVVAQRQDEELNDAEDEIDDDIDDEESDDEDSHNVDAEDSDDILVQARSGTPLLKEKRVKVGEKVCAIGIYSGQRGGLIPGGLGADHFIKLIRGRPADIEQLSRSATLGRFFGGLIGLVLIHVATFGVMLAYRHDPTAQRKREEEAYRLASSRDVNTSRLARLISRGVSINGRDAGGLTLLGAAAGQSPAAARWLIDHGADVNVFSQSGLTPLMEAASRGQTEVVKLLLAAKADVNLRSAAHDATALTFAVNNGHSDIANLLRSAGAKEEAEVAAEAPSKE
jgi:hypothetical protein